MAKRNRQNRTLPVKAGMFSNYSQWWLSGGDLSQIAGAALLFSDTPYGRIQASLFNVWAANCISARAETLASVDLKLYRKSGDQDEDDEEIVEHPVLDLLEEVNPINLQKTSFREQIERQLSIHGDCYVHKVRGASGKPSEMYILPAQFVEPIPDAMRLVAGYRYQTSTVLSTQDIIRIYYPSDENPLLARSPMTSAISAINNYSLSDLAQQGIDRRGGQGGGIVMVDFNTISGDPQRFMQEWDATRSDPRNAGRDAFLPTDSNYQSGTLTAQQQQREERATRLIREIMAALRVPPSLAGDYKDASVLANAAQQSKNFWGTLMLFEVRRIEEALNVGLLWSEYKGSKEEGLYLKHDLDAVEALSEGENAEAARDQVKAMTADTAFASGIISLNEARVYIGQEPIDDPRADEVLQPEIVDPMTEGLEEAPPEEMPELDALLDEAGSVKAGKGAGGFDSVKQRKWYFAQKDDKKSKSGVDASAQSPNAKDKSKYDENPFASDIAPNEEGFVAAPVHKIEDMQPPHLTQEESDAVRGYSSFEYLSINNCLRHGYSEDWTDLPQKEFDRRVKTIDSAIEKSTLPANQTLYRGLRGIKVDTGSVITEKGFVSTSTTDTIGAGFATLLPSTRGVLIHLKAKKGQKALLATDHAKEKNEKEVLLPRGTSYRITKNITPKNGGGNYDEFEAEVIE